MERLFLQLIKKKLTSLDKFPPLNYHKTLNSHFIVPPLKFQKKIPPLTCPVGNPGSHPLLQGGGGEGEN